MTESVGSDEMEGPADSGAGSEGVSGQHDGGADGGASGRLGSDALEDENEDVSAPDAETDSGAE